MTYDMLKRFAKFLKVKWDVSSGAIRIAEPPDFDEEYVTLDWDIRPDDVREFSRIEGLCFTTDKPTKPGFYFYREDGEVYVCEVCEVEPVGLEKRRRLFVVIADIHPPDGIDPRGLLDDAGGEWAGPLESPV